MAQRMDSFFVSAHSKQKGGKLVRKEKFKYKTAEKETVGVDSGEEKVKKPFDKKTYRLKKYSNKYKLDKWEEQRKKKLLRNYYKDVKNEAPLGSYKPINFDDDDHELAQQQTNDNIVGRFVRHPDLIAKDIDETDKSLPSSTQKSETLKTQVNSKAAKKDAFWKAKAEFKRLKQSKEETKRENENSKKEREQKMEEYKKKKAERFKKLSRKTKKGQPVMTGRLELLLEKIEKSK